MVEVSVVMTVYNAERFLKGAIESVLNQTYTNFEFIIVNDGSTDRSLEIINSFKDVRINVIDQENSGVSRAANRAIGIAKGKYIARLDADDISIESRFQKQIQFLNENTDYSAIGSNAIITDIDGNYLYTSKLPTNWEELQTRIPKFPIFNSSAIFKKDDFIKVGGYNTTFCNGNYAEDRILWYQLSALGKITNLEDVLIKHRYSPLSLSNLDLKSIKILNKICDAFISGEEQAPQSVEALLKFDKRKRYHNYYLKVGSIHLKNGIKLKAAKNFLLSLYNYPFELSAYLKLFACLFPYSVIKVLKKVN
jgi:glycosyltransferase involved in cell wall biosynthesis